MAFKKSTLANETADALIDIEAANKQKNEGFRIKVLAAGSLFLAACLAQSAGGEGLVKKIYPEILAFFTALAVCQSIILLFYNRNRKGLPLILATLIVYGFLAGLACLVWRISSGSPFSLNN
jgi:hypothetical protein